MAIHDSIFILEDNLSRDLLYQMSNIEFSKTTSHVFPAVSKQGYTDHYLVA